MTTKKDYFSLHLDHLVPLYVTFLNEHNLTVIIFNYEKYILGSKYANPVCFLIPLQCGQCFYLSTFSSFTSRKAHAVQPGAKLFRKGNRSSVKKEVPGAQ